MPEFNNSATRQYLIDELINSLPEIRRKCRMSQSDLARKIGKSRQTVSDIERKVAPMGWDTYLAIVLVLQFYKVYDSYVDGTQLREHLRNEIFN